MHILTALTPANIANLLRDAGYLGKIESFDDYFYVYTSSDGWGLNIRLFGDMPKSPDELATSIQYWSYWKIPLEETDLIQPVCNELNMNNRFIKCFITKGDECAYPTIVHDVYCLDGIGEKVFIALLEHFVVVRRSFFDECKAKYNHSKESVVELNSEQSSCASRH